MDCNIMKNKLSIILGIIVSLIVIIGAIVGALRYFASNEDVDKTVSKIQKTQMLLQERQDLSIHDDRIERRRRDIQMMEQQVVIKRRPEPITDAEKEMIRINKEELKKLEKERLDREKYWKSQK